MRFYLLLNMSFMFVWSSWYCCIFLHRIFIARVWRDGGGFVVVLLVWDQHEKPKFIRDLSFKKVFVLLLVLSTQWLSLLFSSRLDQLYDLSLYTFCFEFSALIYLLLCCLSEKSLLGVMARVSTNTLLWRQCTVC